MPVGALKAERTPLVISVWEGFADPEGTSELTSIGSKRNEGACSLPAAGLQSPATRLLKAYEMHV